MSKPKPGPADEMMTVADVIRHIMRVEGCSRREAERQLHEAVTTGLVPAFLPTATGLKQLPPDAFSVPRSKARH